jgi:hypothetical protein
MRENTLTYQSSRTRTLTLISGVLLLVMTGCGDLFGNKQDATTTEIFDAGRIEPGLINEVEYVPLFPFFSQGSDGSDFEEPRDIYVGYDELIYVVDKRGLHILDSSGRPAGFVPIAGGGTSVIQDRRLHLYVTARRDTLLDGRTWTLPVILHFDQLETGKPRIADIIWHPFDDDSRKFSRPDPIDTDEDVSFTGVGVLYNNSIYVSRKGPVNKRASVILPHNTIMEFTPDGVNVQSIVALHPTRESLRSALFPSDVATFVHPPQRSFFAPSLDFLIAESPELRGPNDGGTAAVAGLRFSTLSIQAVSTPDGIEYRPDTEKLQVTSTPERGDGFLYDEFKFANPSDLMFAADGTNYIFVLDAGKDSLFVFTSQGVEGVAPPPGSRQTRPVVVSFGGTGDGAKQFRRPDGVGYFRKIVYVADTGNNRISRFRLNTDFE